MRCGPRAHRRLLPSTRSSPPRPRTHQHRPRHTADSHNGALVIGQGVPPQDQYAATGRGAERRPAGGGRQPGLPGPEGHAADRPADRGVEQFLGDAVARPYSGGRERPAPAKALRLRSGRLSSSAVGVVGEVDTAPSASAAAAVTAAAVTARWPRPASPVRSKTWAVSMAGQAVGLLPRQPAAVPHHFPALSGLGCRQGTLTARADTLGHTPVCSRTKRQRFRLTSWAVAANSDHSVGWPAISERSPRGSYAQECRGGGGTEVGPPHVSGGGVGRPTYPYVCAGDRDGHVQPTAVANGGVEQCPDPTGMAAAIAAFARCREASSGTPRWSSASAFGHAASPSPQPVAAAAWRRAPRSRSQGMAPRHDGWRTRNGCAGSEESDYLERRHERTDHEIAGGHSG